MFEVAHINFQQINIYIAKSYIKVIMNTSFNENGKAFPYHRFVLSSGIQLQ